MGKLCELDRFRCILFWRFQYIKRKAKMSFINDWERVVEAVNSWQDDEHGSNTHRYVSSAILSVKQHGSSAYDLSKVPSSVLPFYFEYIEMSSRYGYYLNDIVEDSNAFDFLQYIISNELTPLPPIPFLQQNPWESFILKSLSLHLHNAEFYSAGENNESLGKRCYDLMRKLSIDQSAFDADSDSDNIKTKLNKMEMREVVKKEYIKGDSGRGVSSINYDELIKIHKNNFPSSFREDGNRSRAAGLYLWDCNKDKSRTRSDAINMIREIWKPDDEGNPVDSQFGDWVSWADRCIHQGKVLAITKKNKT